PWRIRLRSSTDGGNTYDSTDSVIQPFGGSSWFLTDATAAAYGGRLHHTVLDVQYPANGCHHMIGGLDNAVASKISYRRGTSATAIGALATPGTDAYLVDLASNPDLDHPWMVNTPDGATHVVYESSTSSC